MFVILLITRPDSYGEHIEVVSVCSDERNAKRILRKYCREKWKMEPRNGFKANSRSIATNLSEKVSGEKLFISEFLNIEGTSRAPGSVEQLRTLLAEPVPVNTI